MYSETQPALFLWKKHQPAGYTPASHACILEPLSRTYYVRGTRDPRMSLDPLTDLTVWWGGHPVNRTPSKYAKEGGHGKEASSWAWGPVGPLRRSDA